MWCSDTAHVMSSAVQKQKITVAAGAWQVAVDRKTGPRGNEDSDEEEADGKGVFRDDLLRTRHGRSSQGGQNGGPPVRTGPLPPPPPAAQRVPKQPTGGAATGGVIGSRAAQQVLHTVALPHARPRAGAPVASMLGGAPLAFAQQPESPPSEAVRRNRDIGGGMGSPDSREGSVSPPHIGTGLVRSTSNGRIGLTATLDVDTPDSTPPGSPTQRAPTQQQQQQQPTRMAPQPAQPPLPFQAPADPEEAALLTQMLASNLKDEAEALYEAGHLEAAEKVFSQALVYAPQERSLLCGRCQCSAARGAHAQALADARSVTAMAPGWHVGHALLGAALAAMGARDEAMAAYDTASRLAADPRSEESSLEDAREYMQTLDGLRTGTPV